MSTPQPVCACGQPHPKCAGHRKHDKQPCGAQPLSGARLCRKHLTNPKARAKAAVVAELQAWRVDDATADPGTTLLRLLTQSAARVQLYSVLLEEQVRLSREASNPDHLYDPDEPQPMSLAGIEGLIGNTFGAAGKDGRIYATGEELRGLVRLEAEERDRCARFAKLALDAGIAERIVRLEEGRAEQIVTVIRMALVSLGLSPTDPRVGVAVTTALRQLEAGDAA